MNGSLLLRPNWDDISSIARYFLYIGIIWLSQTIYGFIVEAVFNMSGGFTSQIILVLRMVSDVLAIAAFLSLLYPAVIIRSKALLFGTSSMTIAKIISSSIILLVYSYGYGLNIRAGIEALLSKPQTAGLGQAIAMLIIVGGLLILVGLVLLLVGLYRLSDSMGEYIIVLGWFFSLISFDIGSILIGIGFIHLAKNISNAISKVGIQQLKSAISNELGRVGIVNIKDLEKRLLVPRAAIYLVAVSMLEMGELNASIEGLRIIIAPNS